MFLQNISICSDRLLSQVYHQISLTSWCMPCTKKIQMKTVRSTPIPILKEYWQGSLYRQIFFFPVFSFIPSKFHLSYQPLPIHTFAGFLQILHFFYILLSFFSFRKSIIYLKYVFSSRKQIKQTFSIGKKDMGFPLAPAITVRSLHLMGTLKMHTTL